MHVLTRFIMVVAAFTAAKADPPAANVEADSSQDSRCSSRQDSVEDANARCAGRDAAVAAELAEAPDHPWAGRYVQCEEEGPSIELQVAPAAGFLYSWYGCSLFHGIDCGDVHVCDDGALRLVTSDPGGGRTFGGRSSEFLPVRWGTRRYLLHANELGQFVSDVLARREPCQGYCGSYLLHAGDGDLPASGLPDLPAPYSRPLRKPPFVVMVTESNVCIESLEGLEFHDVDLTVTGGADLGLVPGLVLYPLEHRLRWGREDRIVVSEVSAHSASAWCEVIRFDEYVPPVPEVGWLLASVPPEFMSSVEAGDPCTATGER